MADYKEKFDDLHRAAKRKAREIDEKLGVKGIVEDTARVARDAAGPAGKKAGEVFDDAKSYVSTAANVAGKSVRATRAGAAATAGILKAKDWVKENPGKAAAVS